MDASARVLSTDRLLLTLPPPDAAPRFVRYAIENEPHLAQWEPSRPADYFTDAFWRRRLAQNGDERARDASLRLTLVRRDDPDGPIVGHANFNNIVRGAFQCCTLGYSVDHRSEGRGLMREALEAAIPHVFHELGLHRIQANYVPTNERSGRLLRRLGFVVEGYARDYLFLGGAWRDHVLTSLSSPATLEPR